MAVATTPKVRRTKAEPVSAALAPRPTGRTLAEFEPLEPAEIKLRDAARNGEIAHIADTCPIEETASNRVRANFVRFLALGGDAALPVHEHGVQICGAWLVGPLSLTAAEVGSPLALHYSRLEFVEARDARLLRFSLSGSRLEKGLNGFGLQCSGNIHLDECFQAYGTVGLENAWIGGQLDCKDGQFLPELGNALNFDAARVDGSVFLDRKFYARGVVRLIGASIGGQLSCRGGHFSNTDKNKAAMSCENSSVRRVLIFDRVTVDGRIDLTGMSVGALADDSTSWHAASSIRIDGLTYERLGRRAPTSASVRIEWLKRQSEDDLNENFKPQPWEQLIAVLRAMGHADDAKLVAIAKQRQMRHAGLLGKQLWGTSALHKAARTDVIRRPLDGLRVLTQAKWPKRLLHTGWGLFAGYGYRPLRLSLVMVSVWLMLSALFWLGMIDGAFAPTSPIIQTDPAAVALCGAGPDAGDNRWTQCSAVPDAYTSFQPTFYSLDLILPLVDLQQETEWAPVVMVEGETYWAGVTMRGLMWFEILFGWLASLLLVASLTSLIKKD